MHCLSAPVNIPQGFYSNCPVGLKGKVFRFFKKNIDIISALLSHLPCKFSISLMVYWFGSEFKGYSNVMPHLFDILSLKSPLKTLDTK